MKNGISKYMVKSNKNPKIIVNKKKIRKKIP